MLTTYDPKQPAARRFYAMGGGARELHVCRPPSNLVNNLLEKKNKNFAGKEEQEFCGCRNY